MQQNNQQQYSQRQKQRMLDQNPTQPAQTQKLQVIQEGNEKQQPEQSLNFQLEINRITSLYNGLQKQQSVRNQDHFNQLEQLEQALSSLQAKNSDYEKLIVIDLQKMDKMDQEIRQLNNQVIKLEKLNNQSKQKSQETKELLVEQKTLKDQKEKQQQENVSLVQNVQSLSKIIDNLNSRIKQQDVVRVQRELDELKTNYAKLEVINQGKQNERDKYTAKNVVQIKSLEDDLNIAMNQNKSMEKEIFLLKEHLRQMDLEAKFQNDNFFNMDKKLQTEIQNKAQLEVQSQQMQTEVEKFMSYYQEKDTEIRDLTFQLEQAEDTKTNIINKNLFTIQQSGESQRQLQQIINNQKNIIEINETNLKNIQLTMQKTLENEKENNEIRNNKILEDNGKLKDQLHEARQQLIQQQKNTQTIEELNQQYHLEQVQNDTQQKKNIRELEKKLDTQKKAFDSERTKMVEKIDNLQLDNQNIKEHLNKVKQENTQFQQRYLIIEENYTNLKNNQMIWQEKENLINNIKDLEENNILILENYKKLLNSDRQKQEELIQMQQNKENQQQIINGITQELSQKTQILDSYIEEQNVQFTRQQQLLEEQQNNWLQQTQNYEKRDRDQIQRHKFQEDQQSKIIFDLERSQIVLQDEVETLQKEVRKFSVILQDQQELNQIDIYNQLLEKINKINNQASQIEELRQQINELELCLNVESNKLNNLREQILSSNKVQETLEKEYNLTLDNLRSEKFNLQNQLSNSIKQYDEILTNYYQLKESINNTNTNRSYEQKLDISKMNENLFNCQKELSDLKYDSKTKQQEIERLHQLFNKQTLLIQQQEQPDVYFKLYQEQQIQLQEFIRIRANDSQINSLEIQNLKEIINELRNQLNNIPLSQQYQDIQLDSLLPKSKVNATLLRKTNNQQQGDSQENYQTKQTIVQKPQEIIQFFSPDRNTTMFTLEDRGIDNNSGLNENALQNNKDYQLILRCKQLENQVSELQDQKSQYLRSPISLGQQAGQNFSFQGNMAAKIPNLVSPTGEVKLLEQKIIQLQNKAQEFDRLNQFLQKNERTLEDQLLEWRSLYEQSQIKQNEINNQYETRLNYQLENSSNFRGQDNLKDEILQIRLINQDLLIQVKTLEDQNFSLINSRSRRGSFQEQQQDEEEGQEFYLNKIQYLQAQLKITSELLISQDIEMQKLRNQMRYEQSRINENEKVYQDVKESRSYSIQVEQLDKEFNKKNFPEERKKIQELKLTLSSPRDNITKTQESDQVISSLKKQIESLNDSKRNMNTKVNKLDVQNQSSALINSQTNGQTEPSKLNSIQSPRYIDRKLFDPYKAFKTSGQQ